MTFFCACILITASILAAPAMATPHPSPMKMSKALSYDAALQAAQKRVERERESFSNTPGAQTSDRYLQLTGRPVKVGDHWRVQAWRFNRVAYMMRADRTLPIAESGTFEYRVTRGPSLGNPEIEFTITQTIDPRIESIILVTDLNLKTKKKTYILAQNLRPLSVAPEGVHSPMTVLELFPVEPPEIATALRTTPQSLPELPSSLGLGRGSRATLKADLSKSVHLENDDFFGRKIEALWQRGDLWPRFLRTHNGIALLIQEAQ